MKRFIRIILFILISFTPAIYACSQVPVPPPPPGRQGPPPPSLLPGERDVRGDRPLQQLVTVQGTVDGYTANDRNEYDGFTLNNSGGAVNVRFAPHMAAQLMAAIKAGSGVSVQGFYETTPEGLNVLHLVNTTVGGQTLADTPPAQPIDPTAQTIQSFNGTISDIRRDRQGMPNGIVLGSNQVIELGPGIYTQLEGYLKPGATIAGSGFKMTPPQGVVLARNVVVIHAQTITINGQTYMVR